jgi:hypothetical protein
MDKELENIIGHIHDRKQKQVEIQEEITELQKQFKAQRYLHNKKSTAGVLSIKKGIRL